MEKMYVLVAASIYNDYFVDADCYLMSTDKAAVISEAVRRHARAMKKTETEAAADLVTVVDTEAYFSAHVGDYFIFGREVTEA